MTVEELQGIIKDHALWVEDKGGKKADLQEADLRWADLQRAQLQRADLQWAQLQWAQLQEADLRGADLQNAALQGADLQRADLRDANLRDANLRGAILQGADLQRADLQGADLQRADLQNAALRWADLQRADLRWADLQGADLRWADLQGADLRGADLRGADLRWAKTDGVNANDMTAGYWSVCPEEGSFTAFKKLKDDKIAKLLIPEYAKRSSATTRKCRCSEAVVVEITDEKGDKVGVGYSKYGGQNGEKTVYTVGQTVYPDGFDKDRWNECSNGIHFFMTRKEAEEY